MRREERGGAFDIYVVVMYQTWGMVHITKNNLHDGGKTEGQFLVHFSSPPQKKKWERQYLRPRGVLHCLLFLLLFFPPFTLSVTGGSKQNSRAGEALLSQAGKLEVKMGGRLRKPLHYQFFFPPSKCIVGLHGSGPPPVHPVCTKVHCPRAVVFQANFFLKPEGFSPSFWLSFYVFEVVSVSITRRETEPASADERGVCTFNLSSLSNTFNSVN